MSSNRRSGFTLLEVVIVMAVLAILVGAIAPAAGSILRSQGRQTTLAEMELLALASEDFYRDTRQFPSGPLELLTSAVPGWSGPYLRGTVEDPWSNQSGYAVDGFGNAYTFASSGFELTITSDGADRTNGTADDHTVVVNMTPLLRKLTLAELDVLNAAVTRYNAVYLGTAPLSSTWGSALATLEANGYLPTGSGYDTDEWGDTYTADPPGVSPLTAVRSSNIP